MTIIKPVSASTETAPPRRDCSRRCRCHAAALGRRARAADPIVFGWVGPLSPPGGYAEGTNMKYAAQMAVDEINAQGGLLGRPRADGIRRHARHARRRPLRRRAADTQNKVVAIIGEFHSGVALAEMEVVHKYGIPFMFCDVWSNDDHRQGLSRSIPQRTRAWR